MAKSLNEWAADWWVERFGLVDKRQEFRAALLKHLPDHDWETYNDYDPCGILLDAVREVVPCRSFGFSGDELFPSKTGLNRRGGKLFAKEGYGDPWTEVT